MESDLNFTNLGGDSVAVYILLQLCVAVLSWTLVFWRGSLVSFLVRQSSR